MYPALNMATESFIGFPDEARVWVVAADRALPTASQNVVDASLGEFFGNWHSHGRKVVASSFISHDRFVIIAAHVPGNTVSGCGIDASVQQLDDIAASVGFGRAGVLDVLYLDGEVVKQVSRIEFAGLAREGKIDPDTIVFDTAIDSLLQLRNGDFNRRVEDSWHASVFSVAGKSHPG